MNNLVHTYTDQQKVKDGYSKCIKRLNHLIVKLNYKITQYENKDKFFTYPHKLLSLDELKSDFFSNDLRFIK